MNVYGGLLTILDEMYHKGFLPKFIGKRVDRAYDNYFFGDR